MSVVVHQEPHMKTTALKTLSKFTAICLTLAMIFGVSNKAFAASLFSDGFETNNFTNWDSAGSGWDIGTSAHSGTYRAHADGEITDSSLTKAQSTTGYEDVTLTYWYNVYSTWESNDHVYVEWYDGDSWSTLFTHDDGNEVSVWTEKIINLPAGADENADFQIRFRATLSSTSDEFYLDDVSLTGASTAEDRVKLVDSWVGDSTFDTSGMNYTPGAGSNRVALVAVFSESNTNPVANVNQVTLGGQTLTAIENADGIVVDSGSIHNIVWLGYLNEADIGSMSGSAINVTWDQAPNTPYGETMVQAATYKNVSQTTPVADSASNTNTSAGSIQAGNVSVGDADRLVYVTLSGNPADHIVPSGYTEHIEQDGPSNDLSTASLHRDATTSSTENPLADWSGTNRLAIVSAALNFAPPVSTSATVDTLTRFYEGSDNKVRVDYTLSDDDSYACNFTTAATQVQYSTSAGGPWTDATIYGTTTGATSSPGGTAHTASSEPLYWNASGVANGNYYVQIKPHNGTNYANDYAISGSTIQIFTPLADNLMRHGKTFLEEIKQYFFFRGYSP